MFLGTPIPPTGVPSRTVRKKKGREGKGWEREELSSLQVRFSKLLCRKRREQVTNRGLGKGKFEPSILCPIRESALFSKKKGERGKISRMKGRRQRKDREGARSSITLSRKGDVVYITFLGGREHEFSFRMGRKEELKENSPKKNLKKGGGTWSKSRPMLRKREETTYVGGGERDILPLGGGGLRHVLVLQRASDAVLRAGR